MGAEFLEIFQKSHKILEESEANKGNENGERVGGCEASTLDVNKQSEETGSQIGPQDGLKLELGSTIHEKQMENNPSVHLKETEKSEDTFLLGAGLRKMGGDPNVEGESYLRKRRRYSVGEKGKEKLDENQLLRGVHDASLTHHLNLHLQTDPIEEKFESENAFKIGSSVSDAITEHNLTDVSLPGTNNSRENSTGVIELEAAEILSCFSELHEISRREHETRRHQDAFTVRSSIPGEITEHNFSDVARKSWMELQERKAILKEIERLQSRRTDAIRRHDAAKYCAKSLARLNTKEQLILGSTKQEKEESFRESEESEDMQGPFAVAMEMIKKQISSPFVSKKPSNVGHQPAFKWVPSIYREGNLLKHKAPCLLDLSMKVLAKNAEAMVSLQHVPDVLRSKLSRLLCVSRKMDAHFVELLARGSPTEIRVNNCTLLTEEEFIKIFGSCDSKNLTVLKLDLCGRCISDIALRATIAQSSGYLPALTTFSMRGAFQLTDTGLTALCAAAPALQSVNVSQCSLLTSAAISALTTNFAHTLRELYIDDCQHIDAMQILPALEKLKCLEVLSVAGIETVCDDFVSAVVKACGANMKELVFANCLALTDRSLKTVVKYCPGLCALDLSYLRNLTDATIQHLANGCRTIRRLKFCGSNFSDEAIAALLEVSGSSLNELSLNKISRVDFRTACSLAKCARNLFSLDLSWCRNLPDEAVGLIVDSCLSLKVLKLFGCTQITDVFLNGHSNSLVQIVGLRTTQTILQHPDVFEPPEAPLRYSSH